MDSDSIVAKFNKVVATEPPNGDPNHGYDPNQACAHGGDDSCFAHEEYQDSGYDECEPNFHPFYDSQH